MNSELFFIELRDYFKNKNDYDLILRMLHINEMLGEKFQDNDFFEFSRNNLKPIISAWSPASLGLLSLTGEPFDTSLPLKSTRQLPEELITQGEQTYNSWKLSKFTTSLTFEEASLIAIFFVDQPTKIKECLSQLEFDSNDNPGLQSIFACIFGLIENPVKITKTLENCVNNIYFFKIFIQALLSNPIDHENLYLIINDFRQSLSLEYQSHLLNVLRYYDQSLVTRMIESELSDTNLFPINSTSTNVNLESLEKKLYLADISSYIEKLEIEADSRSEISLLCNSILSKNFENHAVSLLSSHIKSHTFLFNNSIPAEIIYTALGFLKEANKYDRTNVNTIAIIILLLAKLGKLDEAKEFLDSLEIPLPDKLENASIFVASSVLSFFADDMDLCQQKIEIAISQYECLPKNILRKEKFQFLIPLFEILLNLKLTNEQYRLLKILGNLFPYDDEFNLIHAKILFSLGDYIPAIKLLTLVSISDQNNLEADQLLIYALEALDEWQSAYSERLRYKERYGSNNKFISLNEAYCALRSDKPSLTIEICRELTEEAATIQSDANAEKGLINWLIGEAELKLSKIHQAIENFTKALENDPGLHLAWIGLSHCYQSLGDYNQSERTLLRAINALPHSYEIALELGILYLESNKPSRAHQFLQKAKSLTEFDHFPIDKNTIKIDTPCWERINYKPKIEFYMGKALYLLGYTEEAKKLNEYSKQYIEKGLADSPNSMHGYAKLLIQLNQENVSVPILRKVIRLQPENKAAHLDLAKAIYETQNSTKSLEEVISLLTSLNNKVGNLTNPEKIEVNLLHGETLLKLGRYKEASDVFQGILQNLNISDTDNQIRAYRGLADSALGIEDYDLAITTLQEVLKLNPNDNRSLEYLSQAYLFKGLINNSLQTAYSIYKMNPSDLSVINEFIHHCSALLEMSAEPNSMLNALALQVLERAIEAAPSDPDLLLAQAEFLEASNQHDLASNSLLKLMHIPHIEWSPAFQAAKKMIAIGELNNAKQLLSRAFDHFLSSKKIPQNENYDQSNSVTIYSQSVTTKNNEENLFSDYAALILQLDSPEKAIEILEIGLEHFPGSSHLSISIADIYAKSGQIDKARQYLNDAIDQNPMDISIQIDAAYFYLFIGQLPTAVAVINNAYTLSKKWNDPKLFQKALLGLADISFLILDFDNAEVIYQNYDDMELLDSGSRGHAQALNFILNDQIYQGSYLDPYEANSTNLCQLAIKTRLYAEEAGIESALSTETGKIFQSKLNNFVCNDIFEGIMISQIALSLGLWGPGSLLTKKLITDFPDLPISHYLYGKMLITLEQVNYLCNTLRINNHSPKHIISDNSSEQFIHIIRKLRHYYDLELNTNQMPATLVENTSVVNNSNNWKFISEVINYLIVLGKLTFSRVPTLENLNLSFLENNFRQYQLPSLLASYFLTEGKITSQWTNENIESMSISHPLPWVFMTIGCTISDPQISLDYAMKIPQLTTNNKVIWATSEPILLSLFAYIYEKQKNTLEGLNNILQALTIWSDETEWHLIAANYYLEESIYRPQEAIAHLQIAIENNKTDPLLYVTLHKIFIDLEDYDSAVDVLSKGIKQSPESPVLWLSIAELYWFLGNPSKASSALKKINETNIEDKHFHIQKLYLEADICFLNGQYQNVIEIAKNILEINENQSRAYELISSAYQYENKSEEALAALQKAIEISDDPIHLEIKHLELIETHKGYAIALDKAFGLLKNYPTNPLINSKIAKLLVENGETDAAFNYAAFALKNINPELDSELISELNFIIGNKYYQEGNLDQAIKYYTDAIKQNTHQKDYYLKLTDVYMDRREIYKALEFLQQAIKLYPEEARFYYQAGFIQKELKDYSNAEQLLQKAIQLSPNDMQIRRLHGLVVVLSLIHNHKLAKFDSNL